MLEGFLEPGKRSSSRAASPDEGVVEVMESSGSFMMGAGGEVLGYTFWRLEGWYDMQLLAELRMCGALARVVEYRNCLAKVGATVSEEIQTVGQVEN